MNIDYLEARRADVVKALGETRAIRGLFDGSLTVDGYARYLANVHYYAQFSPRVMAIAAGRCMDTNGPLGTYLLRHAEEEFGHDAWALEDLQDLGIAAADVRASRPVVSCEAMVGYIQYLAVSANPLGLFGWMYVLEGVGSDLGIRAAERIRSVLKLAGDRGVRFVERHGINDAQHAHDLGAEIALHVQRAEDIHAIERVADIVGELYVRMFREIGGETPSWG